MDPRLGNAARLQQAKNYPAAEQIYRLILQSKPKDADALLLLGLLLHETGRHALAIESLRRAQRVQPNQPEIRQTLTGPLLALGRLKDAIVEAREVVRLKPMSAEAHHALSVLLLRAQDARSALPHAKRASELNPHWVAAHIQLGQVLSNLRHYSEALAAITAALAIEPKSVDALTEKGMILRSIGRIDEAITAYESAISASPRNLMALNNLGGCYLTKARAEEALRCFETAVKIAPELAMPRNNLGAVLKEMGRLDDAVPHFRQALQLDPAYTDALNNLGTTLGVMGEFDQATASLRAAADATPAFVPALDNLLLMMLGMQDVAEIEVTNAHREFGRRFADPLGANARRFAEDARPDRRLRVGYVSPDFREHSIRYFIEPILAHHDRSTVQVICYSTGGRSDEVTRRLSGLSDEWHQVTGLNDEQFADLVRSHAIDILVDLAGHTAENRLLAFARKPAPVQVTYLGYPATTGMASMDYRLTDAHTEPTNSDLFYTEKLVRLPNAFFVYGDDRLKPYSRALPADTKGFFTFGSFNNYTKITPALLDNWAEILAAVPGSRLLMKSKPLENPSTLRTVREAFDRRGVRSDRLDLRTWVTLEQHFALLRSVDLMLDSYPYNGHTTSCQSIWAGAAVVTLCGDTFRSRVGATILRELGLADLITTTREQYVRRAVELATELTRLRELRPVLRDRMAASSLCDAARFCRDLELAYRDMWSAALSTIPTASAAANRTSG